MQEMRPPHHIFVGSEFYLAKWRYSKIMINDGRRNYKILVWSGVLW